MLQEIASFKKRIHIISRRWVKKQSSDVGYNSERLLQPELISEGSINVVNALCFGFQQFFGQFTMLLVERSSEPGPFRHLSNHVFRSL